MEINFKLVDRDNPIINIIGYVDLVDYCMYFYDSYDDFYVRVPINPYNYYSDEYYAYLNLLYAFETDEAFMLLIKEFAESEFKKFKFMRPNYDLILEKI